MDLLFYKYEGTGNDFVCWDNRDGRYRALDSEEVARLCHRRWGVGADGVLVLEQAKGGGLFYMRYINADGKPSSFCGNGGRCALAFAHFLGLGKAGEVLGFEAADGWHEGWVGGGEVALSMQDCAHWSLFQGAEVLDTGSPHLVHWVAETKNLDVQALGRRWRYDEAFAKTGGINVNFAQWTGESIVLRTYERGVEAETWSCGTGATATALSWAIRAGIYGPQEIKIETLGGTLSVSFERLEDRFTKIFLKGPSRQVFTGLWPVKD